MPSYAGISAKPTRQRRLAVAVVSVLSVSATAVAAWRPIAAQFIVGGLSLSATVIALLINHLEYRRTLIRLGLRK
jgi:hypothetical protein